EEVTPLVVRQKTPGATTTPVATIPTRNSDATPAVRIVRVDRLHRSPLPLVAILCALFLLLTGLGSLLLAHNHTTTTGKSGQNTLSGQQTSPAGGSPTPASTSGV